MKMDQKGQRYCQFQIMSCVQDYNKREKQIRLREPDLLIVITGGSMSYVRPDGVKIIPLACLRD